VPSNPLITRTSVKGCEALRLRKEVPPTEGQDQTACSRSGGVRPPRGGPVAKKPANLSVGPLRVTIEDQPEARDRRPATWISWRTNGHLRTCDRGTSRSSADDLLAVTPVMLEARVLRSTVRLTVRNGDGHREPVSIWTSSSDGSLRRKRTGPLLGAGSPIEPLRTGPIMPSESLTWPSDRCR
jgi:hypothetical protein